MNDKKVKIFEYLDTLVKMCRSKGNGASLIIEEEEIISQINEYDMEIEELQNSISTECYDSSAEMADRNIEIITKKLIQQLKTKIKNKSKELDELKIQEKEYNSLIENIKNNKKGHENYINSLSSRLENSENEETIEKYKTSIKIAEEKIEKANHELERKNKDYKKIQNNIESLSNDIFKLQENLKSKENLLAETQENLKDKNSYLDQTKVEKIKEKIEELDIKKKSLNKRVEEIQNNNQYIASKIKESINAEKAPELFSKNVIDLVNQAHKTPYMNVDANKLLEEALLKATQARDSFALEIDQKNYSLLETINPGKIRIDHLKNRIEKWNIEKEEIKEKIFIIDNDQNFNYDEKYIKLNEILDTMKKELSEFEIAYENNDIINLSSKSDLKVSIEEKKKEIFDTENILAQFRKDEADDIAFANELYTHNIKRLEAKIASATLEIDLIKNDMIARKNGLIDITTQNRDKDKLKDLAVKVIDIKHRRQFAEKPIEIAKELENLLKIEIIPYLEVIEEEPIEKTIQDIKDIIGESSIEVNINKEESEPFIQDKKIEGPKITIEPEIEEVNDDNSTSIIELEEKDINSDKELEPKDFNLVIPPQRGLKVIEEIEIEDEEVEDGTDTDEAPVIENNTSIENKDTIKEDSEKKELDTKVTSNIESEKKEPEKNPMIEKMPPVHNDDSKKEIEKENINPNNFTIEDSKKENLQNDTVQLNIESDEKELAIGKMINMTNNTENKNEISDINNNEDANYDNDLSQELDQYLNNLDLPIS